MSFWFHFQIISLSTSSTFCVFFQIYTALLKWIRLVILWAKPRPECSETPQSPSGMKSVHKHVVYSKAFCTQTTISLSFSVFVLQEFEIELEGSQYLRILCYEKCYDKSMLNKDDNEIVDKIMGKGQVQVRDESKNDCVRTFLHFNSLSGLSASWLVFTVVLCNEASFSNTDHISDVNGNLSKTDHTALHSFVFFSAIIYIQLSRKRALTQRL